MTINQDKKKKKRVGKGKKREECILSPLKKMHGLGRKKGENLLGASVPR